MNFTNYTTKKNKSLPIVAPPPSAGTQKGGTNLDAALAHLRPNFERLLPRIGKDKKAAAGDTKTKR